jgi:hypothetical protein
MESIVASLPILQICSAIASYCRRRLTRFVWLGFSRSDEHEDFRKTIVQFTTRRLLPGECPLQQRFRDVMAYLGTDGTAEIPKAIISGEILSKGSVSL